MALILRDQMSVQVEIPDDIDSLTMRETVRLTIAIVLEVLFILARMILIGFFILRGLVEVWPAIGLRLNLAFVDLCGFVASGALEYGLSRIML